MVFVPGVSTTFVLQFAQLFAVVTGEKAVDDSMHNNAVSDCVLRSIKRIRFMKPEAGICVIQWPFVFSPG